MYLTNKKKTNKIYNRSVRWLNAYNFFGNWAEISFFFLCYPSRWFWILAQIRRTDQTRRHCDFAPLSCETQTPDSISLILLGLLICMYRPKCIVGKICCDRSVLTLLLFFCKETQRWFPMSANSKYTVMYESRTHAHTSDCIHACTLV